MTKTLTEQWREGKLPFSRYYVKFVDGSIDNITLTSSISLYESEHIKEVLAPVPSYEEYKELVNKTDELVQKIHILNEQNTKQYNELCDEIKKNNILEKKLEIATKALNGIRVWVNTGNGGEKAVKKVCEKALKEMEGVK